MKKILYISVSENKSTERAYFLVVKSIYTKQNILPVRSSTTLRLGKTANKPKLK